MRPIHDRMPVVLDPDAEGAWLDADGADDRLDLLVPAPDDARRARGLGPGQRRAQGRAGADRAREEQGAPVLAGPAPIRRGGGGAAAVTLAVQGRPPIGRSSSTCQSWLKPIIATITSSSCTWDDDQGERPSRSSGNAGESSPSFERANQSGAAIAAKIARMIASAAPGQDATAPAHHEEREQDVEPRPDVVIITATLATAAPNRRS